MQMYTPPRVANKAALLACLLAATTLLAGPWRVQAESPAAATVNRSSIPSGGMVTLARHTPAKVLNGTATRIAHYNPEQKLRLALVVQPPKMAEEEKFLKELTTKGSPSFHKFLSADEWNARFGPSVADEQKVVDWATSSGFTVTKRYPNRLIVDVEAPAGTIETALNVTINSYKIDEDVNFSNDRDPQIPATLSGIVSGVLGLNSIQRVHGMMPLSRKMKGPDYVAGPLVNKYKSGKGEGDLSKSPRNRGAGATSDESTAAALLSAPVTKPDGITSDSVTVSPFSIFTSQAYDYDALYGLSHCCNVPGNSAGAPPESSIALVTFGDFEDSDVQAFFKYYGFAWNYDSYIVGGTTAPGQDDEAPGDLEYSTATSNSFGAWSNTAHVAVYEIVNGYYSTYADAYENIATDNVARVVSTSYGSAEGDWDQDGYATGTGTGEFHGIFNSMTGEGYTLVASAGDSGSAQDCGDAVQVNWPASDPNFIAAGGTALDLDSNGNFVSEVAWTGDTWSGACANNWGGGGGGASSLFSAPYWQTPLGFTQRAMPDISLNADPDVTWEQYYYNGGWSSFDGTSIVAPELAGFFAQENAYLDYIGSVCGSAGTTACSPMGNPAPYIYYDGIDGAPHNPFYDITSGCNSNDITAYYGLTTYCAKAGYDQATGWGSANMMQLAWGINWELIPAYGNPSLTFGGPTVNTWYNSDQIVDWTLADAGSSGLPAPGAAGFTLGWDSIPADPQSEAHGGSGNSFYSGPQYPFSTFGCVDMSGALCQAASGQGCHTVHVEGWDNQGRTTTGTYGPVCYDSVAPTIGISNSPVQPASGWWKSPVVVTLTASDPGGSNASGIYRTYYAINSGTCVPSALATCSVYNGPFTMSTQGQSYIYYFTEDKAGNFSNETYEWVSIDLTAPTTTATLSGTLVSGKYYSPVSVKLTATDTGGSGVQYTYYQVNGGATTTYTGSAFSVSTVGSDAVKYWSVDSAGNVGTAQTASFTIGGIPATLSTPAPGSTLGTANVKFTWTAGAGATQYTLWLGTTGVGSSNLYASGWVTTTSTTVTSIPATSATVYARLFSYMGGKTQYFDYTYTEAAPTPTPAVMTSPAPGSTLGTSNVTFTWTAGTEKTKYQLWIGTTGVGSDNLYASGWVTTLSNTVTSLPATGVKVYVRLFSYGTGGTQYNDYTYTEQ